MRAFSDQRKETNNSLQSEITWSKSIKSWIDFDCPTLQTYLIQAKTIGWLIIHPSEEKLSELELKDVRLMNTT